MAVCSFLVLYAHVLYKPDVLVCIHKFVSYDQFLSSGHAWIFNLNYWYYLFKFSCLGFLISKRDNSILLIRSLILAWLLDNHWYYECDFRHSSAHSTGQNSFYFKDKSYYNNTKKTLGNPNNKKMGVFFFLFERLNFINP